MSIPLCSSNDAKTDVLASAFAYAPTLEPSPTQSPLRGGLCTVPTGAPAPRGSEDFQAIIRSLPQDGGKPETAAELVTQGQRGNQRFEQLFGRVPLTNVLNYVERGNIPTGRDAWARANDAQSIAGLQPLLDRGFIDRNTVVIGLHGHLDEIKLALLLRRELQAEGRVRQFFEPGDNAKHSAMPSLDQRQTYGNLIASLEESNAGGGAVYLGVDAHGSQPQLNELPTAKQVSTVMGPAARIVVLTEGKTGDTNTVANLPDSPLKQWLTRLEAAGIPVEIRGINSR
jgi:hypothetical protein